jgi:hypothetical protein
VVETKGGSLVGDLLAFVADANFAREEKSVQVSKDSIDLGIIVTDEKAALSFYRDGLGLEW